MEKLKYIDGLRGIGAFIVYLCHFVFAFYYAAYSLDPAHAHTASALEVSIGKTPLNVLYSGNFAVELFLVMSGFVLCLGYFKSRDKKKLVRSAGRRYIRLLPPILAACILVWALMAAGLYRNSEAAVLTKSTDWFRGFNSFEPKLWESLYEAFIGCFLFGNNDYLGVLWTMPYLFIGALLVYLLVYLIGENRLRYAAYIALILGSMVIHIYFAGLFIGLFICDLMCTQEKLMNWYKKNRYLSVLIFLAGLYLASYPSIGTDMSGTIYAVMPLPLVVPYHLAGAAMILFAAVGNPMLQKFFGNRVFVSLGRCSYSLYLFHFPVIATFSSVFFLKTVDLLGYHVCVLLDFVLTTIIVLGVSRLSANYIEPLGELKWKKRV